MKALKYIAGIVLALSLTACDDYLTQTSPDKLTSDSYWRNKADVEAAMASAYSALYFAEYSGDRWDFSEVKWPVESFRQDDVEMGADARNYPNWVQLYDYSYNNGNSQFSIFWKLYYRGISFCNQIIDKVGNMSDKQLNDTDRKQLLAEAHFLRGFYHMQILLNWEKIIIRDKYITSTSQLSKAPSERVDAWDFVIAELKAGTELNSTRVNEQVGRATSGAAYAYLGYAYLTMAAEQADKKTECLNEAVKAFDNVKGYSLESDFASMFNGSNKNCKESIFEIQFTLSTANGANYSTQMHRWIGTTELLGWDEIAPSKTLMNEFKKEGKLNDGWYDARLYASVFFRDPYFNDGTGKMYGYDWDTWMTDELGKKKEEIYDRPSFRKFMPATLEALNKTNTDVNFTMMRYANVLLMKAEALNNLGKTEQAIPLINEVRKVHGNMPPMQGTSQAAVQAQIEHERMIEFPLENFRWYDLRRWGKTAEALKAAGRTGFDNSRLFYPIPLTEENSNPLAKK